MYRIVGKDNLIAVNTVAQRSLNIIQTLEKSEEQTIKIDRDILISLVTGYLYLYNAVLEEGLMPNARSSKHKVFTLN